MEEYDTDDGWHVIKRANGWAECSGTFNDTGIKASGVISGLGYYFFRTLHYPLTFKEIPQATYSAKMTETGGTATAMGWQGQPGMYYTQITPAIVTFSQTTTRDITLHIKISGKWK